MNEDSVAPIVNGTNPAEDGEAPQREALVEPTASPGLALVDVVPSASIDTLPAPAVEPPKLPSLPASDVPITEADSDVSPPTPESVQWIKGRSESYRGYMGRFYGWEPRVAVEPGEESSLARINDRAALVYVPIYGTPLPSTSYAHCTTKELFRRLQRTIAQQALVTERASSLLTYWSLSSWFADALPVAPILVINGSAEEGDRVLRTLRALCHYPMLMFGISVPDLKTINWRVAPTLLFNAPNLTKQMAAFLGSSTRRGYLQGRWGEYQDYYGSKAIYLGERVPVDRKLPWSLQVNAIATTATAALTAPPLTDDALQELQDQLLSYRRSNLIKVENSTFDVPAFPPDIRPVANALGACVVGSPKLQSELISLLAPQVEQRLADRSSSLKGMTIEAILSSSHQGKSKLLAAEIAVAVNAIAKARGERLEFKPENIGHTLKELGLYTTRLGKEGRGLILDQATLIRVHELAAMYGGVGLERDKNNLHCPLCMEKNDL